MRRRAAVTLVVLGALIASSCGAQNAPTTGDVPSTTTAVPTPAARASAAAAATAAPGAAGATATAPAGNGSAASGAAEAAPTASTTAAATAASGGASATPAPTTAPATASTAPDPTRLPIGQGISGAPVRGLVWSCETRFNGGGATGTGPWLHDDGTYDRTAKPTVDGARSWPSRLSIALSGGNRVVGGNALPDHTTGTYPVATGDDAYRYDRNPNAITAQTLSVSLPATPALAVQPSCLSLGAIGVLLTGSVIFNALDGEGRDAIAYEIQDACEGHPERSGVYHYHGLTPCIADAGSGHSPLVGYAADGFGIYGQRGAGGVVLGTADLDACHGHTHTITWDGRPVAMYHYHATLDYPYTLGCYRGTPAAGLAAFGGVGAGGNGGGPPSGAAPRPGGPPPNR